MSISFAGTMLLGRVSISYGGSLFIEGVHGPFLGGSFFIGMGYGIVPTTLPHIHREQRSHDQLLPYTRSKVNDTVLSIAIKERFRSI